MFSRLFTKASSFFEPICAIHFMRYDYGHLYYDDISISNGQIRPVTLEDVLIHYSYVDRLLVEFVVRGDLDG